MDHGNKKGLKLVRSDLLRCITAQTRQMFSYGRRFYHGLVEPIFWYNIELWGSFPMPLVWVQSASCSTPSSLADGRPGSTKRPDQPSAELDRTRYQLGHTPSWIEHATSSAIRRAESNTRPSRPSAKLDQSSSADGRAGSTTRPSGPSDELNQSNSADAQAGSTTRPAQPSAELDQTREQLGHPTNWTSPVRRIAELDRTRDKLDHPPSWTSPVRRMAKLEWSRCHSPILIALSFGIGSNLLFFHRYQSPSGARGEGEVV